MSEIHIGPHTRPQDGAGHGHGEPHHTFDREIDTKSIGKWMLGLLVVTLVVEVSMWWMIRGLESFDRRRDPELTPIEQQVKQKLPPAPRLQVGSNFYSLNREHNEGIDADGAEAVPEDMRSDLEDMQALRAQEDAELGSPAWGGPAKDRLRVPIDVAMQVIASRGDQIRPQAPAQPAATDAQPAGTATGQQPAAPQPPAAQEQ